MTDERQASAGRITSIDAVVVRVVCEGPEPAHPSSTVDSSVNVREASVLETRSHPKIAVSDGQGYQSIGTEQVGFPMNEASAVWTGEVKAPNHDEALNSFMPRDRGGPRIGILAAMLIGASGMAWWAGLLDPHRFFNSNPASQIALPERAPLSTDKQATSARTDGQVSPPAGTDLGSKGLEPEPTPHADPGIITPADTVPKTQKTTANKPAVVPHAREKKFANYPAPVPETKPKTIEGWTARQVSGRTAVLQGRTGIWNVAVGDTVPGAGRIDSIVRWGNRWIVATSKGLITTD